MALGTIGCVADGACMSAIMLVLANLMNGYAAATSLTPKVINKVSLRTNVKVQLKHVSFSPIM